jgi:trk system potassium uptake protein TrkH
MNIRPILYIEGILLSILSASMILPMLADIFYGYDDWQVFFVCIVITAFFGGALIFSNQGMKFNISTRGAFFLTNATWIVLPAFGALPFWLSSLNMSATDSFFEAMSGITTTGSTVITGLDYAPTGILLWRAMLQWIGGIGIIIMAMSVLPFLKVGGMQIFKTELAENEKALPRTRKFASSIAIIYVFLTTLCALGYLFAGLDIFDAVAHAMTTISTGGFSTFDASFNHFQGIAPSIVAIIFMTLGGIPFVLYLKTIKNSPLFIIKDTQVRWYLYIIILSTLSTALYLTITQGVPFTKSSFLSLFNVISIMTGTGYAQSDIVHWGSYAITVFLLIMAVGGCAGSTSCGIKIFRFQILYSITKAQVKRLLHPNGVFLPRYNGKTLSKDVPTSVMGFFFIYILGFAFLTLALTFVGLDFMTALSAALSSISNVGPGLSEVIAPLDTYKSLSDSAKLLLCSGMLFGRLEFFTILVMFSPNYWKH